VLAGLLLCQTASQLVYTSRVLVRPADLQLHLPVNLTADLLADYRALEANVSQPTILHARDDIL